MSESVSDRSDRPFLTRRLKAAADIAEAELLRTNVHEQVTSQETANLECVVMGGEWDAADATQNGLYPRMAGFFEVGYNRMEAFRRDDPAAKIVVSIPAGMTAEHGYVALRRKRLLMRLESDKEGWEPLEVDKISMFALDINGLAQRNHRAVREVRIIVAGAMYQAIDQRALGRNDWGIPLDDREDFERLSRQRGQTPDAFLEALENHTLFHAALSRYGITEEEVLDRLASREPARVHDTSTLDFIESALQLRSDLLTPAATTYYVHS